MHKHVCTRFGKWLGHAFQIQFILFGREVSTCATGLFTFIFTKPDRLVCILMPVYSRLWLWGYLQSLVDMPFSGKAWLQCHCLADLGCNAMLMTGRTWLACHWLADLLCHAMHWQTLVGVPLIGRPLLVWSLHWQTWQSLVVYDWLADS